LVQSEAPQLEYVPGLQLWQVEGLVCADEPENSPASHLTQAE